MNGIEQRLVELGISQPPAGKPLFSYQPVVIARDFAFVPGQAPVMDTERPFIGRLGAELSLEEGHSAARLSGLNVLVHLKVALDGDLDRIERCVKLGVFVNSSADLKPSRSWPTPCPT